MKILVMRLALVLAIGFHALAASSLSAEDEPKSASDAEPKTTKISGVLEATVSHEISAGTEAIESLTIKRIIEHGSEVSKGQNVIWFETEEIDKKIKDAGTELRLSRLTLTDDEFAYQQFLKTQKLDRAAADRTHKQAQQDYDNYVQVDRDRQRVTAEHNLKSSQASLENAIEELEQLEKMYLEDDLTEESEEIVLKRAKRAVEAAQYRLDGTKITSDRSVNQGIQRTTEKQEDSLARAQLAHEKSMVELDSTRKRRDIELEKKRDNFQQQEEDLEELRQERKRAVLTSPIDGILLHGPLNRGRLSDKPSSLKRGSKVTSSQVVATVVDPGKLKIRLDLEEQHLSVVSVGKQCRITMNAFPDYRAVGTVKSISTVPYAGTKYDCLVTFRPGKNPPSLLPTMTCELEFEDGTAAGSGGPEKQSKE